MVVGMWRVFALCMALSASCLIGIAVYRRFPGSTDALRSGTIEGRSDRRGRGYLRPPIVVARSAQH